LRATKVSAEVMSLGLCAIIVGAALVGIGLALSGGASSTASLGLFVPSQSPSDVSALANTLAVGPQVMTVYAWGSCYCTYPSPPVTSMQLSLAVGAVTPAQAATIGQTLVSTGHANTDIRIMWEMNGNWFPWGVQALSAAQFVATYRAAEQAFSQVPGNHFSYSWNINAGSAIGGRSEFDTWPGSAYVTNVGIDNYDFHNPQAVETDLGFAQSQNKAVEIDEWGLNGTDDPAYIDFMAGVIDNPANHVVLQSYFSYGGQIDSDITQFPRSEAQYTKDFGASAAPGVAVSVPTTGAPTTTAPPPLPTGPPTTTQPPTTTAPQPTTTGLQPIAGSPLSTTSGSPSTTSGGKAPQAQSGTSTGGPTFPIRAAFYYQWFPEGWNQQGLDPFTHYHPTLGFYDSSNTAVIASHIKAMLYGNITVGIATWWGQPSPVSPNESKRDERMPALLQGAHGTPFKWTVQYEGGGAPGDRLIPGSPNPSQAQVHSDFAYIKAKYTSDPSWLRIGGKPVIFVYGAPGQTCTKMQTYAPVAAQLGFYMMMDIPGIDFTACRPQPDGWYHYEALHGLHEAKPYSYTLTPGFFKANQPTPRLARDPAVFTAQLEQMVASHDPWQLIVSFDEWGEGTAVEDAQEWQSPTGYGTYLDILHAHPG
jgi:hypothetical protein